MAFADGRMDIDDSNRRIALLKAMHLCIQCMYVCMYKDNFYSGVWDKSQQSRCTQLKSQTCNTVNKNNRNYIYIQFPKLSHAVGSCKQ